MILDAQQYIARVDKIVDEAWSTGNVAPLDGVLAADFVSYSPLTGATIGLEAYKQSILGLRQAYPDMVHNITESALDPAHKLLFSRWTLSGTGEQGLIEFTGMALTRIKDGRWVEQWLYFDTLDVLRQMGQIPEAEAS